VILVLHKNSAGETKTLERSNKMGDSEWRTLIAAHKDSIVMADSDADVLKIVGRRSRPRGRSLRRQNHQRGPRRRQIADGVSLSAALAVELQ
jgi:hypothetical protein